MKSILIAATLLLAVDAPAIAQGRYIAPASRDPATGPNGAVLGTGAVVNAGTFSAGPFSWAGKPFKPGEYQVEVYLQSMPDENSDRLEVFEKQVERMSKPIIILPVMVRP
jgi:hypothetical protein